jgi:hypothetical protein
MLLTSKEGKEMDMVWSFFVAYKKKNDWMSNIPSLMFFFLSNDEQYFWKMKRNKTNIGNMVKMKK